MDHHHCLEVLAVRGPSEKIASLRDHLSAIRGILQVRIAAVSGDIGTSIRDVVRSEGGRS
jgi:metal-responsive CopG/Arc/MetJ family transcriptional regulator